MKTKICKTCNIKKPLTEFHKCIKKNGTWLRSYCKDCGKKARIEWRNSKKDGYWTVYYLPEEHYVGITNCVHERMNEHKFKGKIINNYEIIGKYKHPAAALMVEAAFHLHGYHGCIYKNK